jgi:hypothetical protein
MRHATPLPHHGARDNQPSTSSDTLYLRPELLWLRDITLADEQVWDDRVARPPISWRRMPLLGTWHCCYPPGQSVGRAGRTVQAQVWENLLLSTQSQEPRHFDG